MSHAKMEVEGGTEVVINGTTIRTHASGEHWRDFVDLDSTEETLSVTIGDSMPRLVLEFDRKEGTAVLRRGDTVLWEGAENPA